MTTETILADEQINEAWSNNLTGMFMSGDQMRKFARAIEQAVLLSEQVQAWKREAERAIDWNDPMERIKNPLTSYGLLVRALRVVAGTTLMEMSNATDYSPAQLSAVEFGRKPVSASIISSTKDFFSSMGLETGTLLHKAAAAMEQQK